MVRENFFYIVRLCDCPHKVAKAEKHSCVVCCLSVDLFTIVKQTKRDLRRRVGLTISASHLLSLHLPSSPCQSSIQLISNGLHPHKTDLPCFCLRTRSTSETECLSSGAVGS